MFKFEVGEPVWKHSGSYQVGGVVIMRGHTVRGLVRYVVELTQGMLMIYNEGQLSTLRVSGAPL